MALVACEDTRRTRPLLRAHGISTPLTSFFEHNERFKGDTILAALRDGKDVALVSDAGTPGISDPATASCVKLERRASRCFRFPGLLPS